MLKGEKNEFTLFDAKCFLNSKANLLKTDAFWQSINAPKIPKMHNEINKNFKPIDILNRL